MRKLFIASLILGALGFTGCASVPMASQQEDITAKKYEVPAGKSNIYIYRNESFGGAIKMPVVIDDKIAGDTAAKTFILKTVEPGKHTIISKTENDAMLEISTDSDKNYYVWQEVKMGVWSARSKLHLVDEVTGQKGVSQCKLVK